MSKVEAALSLVAALGVVGLLAWLHHHGYLAGQAEREAYYQPLMKAAQDAKNAAEKRTAEIDAASKQITSDIEAQHADKEKELRDRADAAGRAILALMRQHESARASCGQLSAVPRGDGLDVGTSASRERDQRFAIRVSGVGGACEHDAAQVAEWQDWYVRQRALTKKNAGP